MRLYRHFSLGCSRTNIVINFLQQFTDVLTDISDATVWYHHAVRLVSSARQRKDELEQRMSTLQESRRELMVQLEQLMMLLKVLQTSLSSL